MATTEEIQKLIMQVQGRQEILDLRAAIEQEEEAVRKTTEALKQLQAQGLTNSSAAKQLEAQYRSDLEKSGQAIITHRGRINELEKGTRNWSGAMQQAGYAIGDFMSTSGGWGQRMNSIANNLQFVTAQMGPWGIAAGVLFQTIATGLTLMERQSKDAAKKVGDDVEGLKARIKELEDNPVKLAIDLKNLDDAKDKLDELQRGMKAFRQLGETYSGYEKQSGRAVGLIVDNAPGGTKKLGDDLKANFNANDPELARLEKAAVEAKAGVAKARKTLETLASMGEDTTGAAMAVQGMETEATAAQSKVDTHREAAGAKVGIVLDKARAGDQDAQRQLAGMLRNIGQGNMATMISNQSADEIKSGEEAQSQFKKDQRDNQQQINDEAAASRRAAEEDAKTYNSSHAGGPQKVVKFDAWSNTYRSVLDTTGWRRGANGGWVKGGAVAVGGGQPLPAGFNEGAPLGVPAPAPGPGGGRRRGGARAAAGLDLDQAGAPDVVDQALDQLGGEAPPRQLRKEDFGLGTGPLTAGDKRILAARRRREAKSTKEIRRGFARAATNLKRNPGLASPGPAAAARRPRQGVGRAIPPANAAEAARRQQREDEARLKINAEGRVAGDREQRGDAAIRAARQADIDRQTKAQLKQKEIMDRAKKKAPGADDQAANVIQGVIENQAMLASMNGMNGGAVGQLAGNVRQVRAQILNAQRANEQNLFWNPPHFDA